MNSRLEEKNLYLIIAHNHPSGNTAPSNEDICFTSKIEAFFRSTNRFLGHIIISPNKDVFSYYTKRTKWGKYGKDESSFYVKSVKKNKKIIRSTWRRKIN